MNSTDRFIRSASKVATLVELLGWRALQQPDLRTYTFLTDGEAEEVHITYGELERQARAIGAFLQDLGATGKRALLLYPPGPEYIAGFFGCLYAGVVAVPAYPPDPTRLTLTLPRLQTIVADAQATVALTTVSILSLAKPLFELTPDLGHLQWVATDAIEDSLEDRWQEPAIAHDTLAFLQYTSGSTRTPRGVMLTHGNLLHNSALIARALEATPSSIGVLWLPPYHDMGLIGGVLQPVYIGVHCILMSPVSFLKRPLRWLQAISRYKATISGGPNFAYDLCVRKATPEQLVGLDLSSWSLAFNGAEPVRQETLVRFAAAFEPYGFRREAFYPCYGLAEATLIVSGGPKSTPPVLHTVQKAALKQNQVVEASAGEEAAQTLVGCGRPLGEQQVVIVQPESRTRSLPDRVGEIWVAGPSIAQGYWNHPEETEQAFRARLADTGEGPFLRTGDLGFMKDGQVFITGRSKDLIIIRGRNHYPQDIEWTVEQSHAALRPGCGAAFSVDVGGEERLVVVQEVYTHEQPDTAEVISAIRRAVAEAHEVQTHAVVLIEPRTIPKTSSGKIQRHACRAGYLAGTLNVVESSILDEAASAAQQEVIPPRESLLVKALMAMEPGARQAVLESHIQEQVAHVLKLAPSQLDPRQPLSTLGLDSVTTIDLVSEIESSLGITLRVESLFQDITISQVAAQAITELTAPPARLLAVPTPVKEVITEHPLSRGQRALWFLQQVTPESGSYNLVHAVRIRGALDIPALQRAFQKLVDRHAALRTTFAVRDGEPVQRVHEHMQVCFQVEDATNWGEAYLNDRLAEEVYGPFDLEQGPLLRLILFTRSVQEHVLLIAVHHTVTDLWSLAVLMAELGVLYPAETKGTPASLKPLRVQYTDYVHWQEEMLAGPQGEQLWSYWQQQLAGELPVLNLPTDRPRPPIQTYRGACQTFRIDAGLAQRLRSLSEAQGSALHVTLLAAFQVLLHRYTGQDTILVGSPKAGRNPQVARLMGYFINSVVLRADLSGNPTFAAFLGQVRQTVLGAFEHDAYPFPLLVERLQPTRDLSRSPLFQAMFAWQKTTRMVNNQHLTSFALGESRGEIQLGGLVLEPISLEQRAVPFDLSLWMAEANGELAALLEYNSDLFDAARITRMAGHFKTLLEGIAANPNRPISALPLLTEAERERLLVEWNATATDTLQAPCVCQLFEAQVERTPEAIAVVGGEKHLTYSELNRRANQLAHYLQGLGVGPEVLVGLCLEHSVEVVVGLLGILKAGGAYLPLDPGYPPERLAFMLEDARAPVLLAQARLVERLPADRKSQIANRKTEVVCLDTDWPTIAQESQENPQNGVTADNLAYVIYTSGSTGTPKGVLISNGAFGNHCRDMQRYYQLDASDRVLQFASLSFDASLEQILPTLISGATLVVRDVDVWAPADFPKKILDLGLTVVNLPPAYWHQVAQDWANAPEQVSVPRLRLVIVGGDVIQPASLDLWWQTPTKDVRLLNAYGPTETTITATTYEISAHADEVRSLRRVPIGHPLANRKVYVLDRYGGFVPVGVPGELHIGGAGVARGYLNLPELTAERFIPDPNGTGARRYRTGDLVCYRSDGALEFLGRADYQVKVRGIRVELGEIEAVLEQHPAVQDAVVLARDEPGGDNHLAAYVVPACSPLPPREGLGEGGPLTTSELRRFAQEKLPSYMVPSAFAVLETLPLTPMGKVDRRALPVPDEVDSEPEEAYVAPRTPIEEELSRMWAEVLGVEQVGVYDNFFALGGHSLLAAQLMARMRDAFLVELSLRDLFDTPTVGGLATTITGSLAGQEEDEELTHLLAELEELSEEEVHHQLTLPQVSKPAGG